MNGSLCAWACVGQPANVPPGSQFPVRLEVKYEADLFDESRAESLKLRPVEHEFFQLEESIKRLAVEMREMLANEEVMRNVNGIHVLVTIIARCL